LVSSSSASGGAEFAVVLVDCAVEPARRPANDADERGVAGIVEVVLERGRVGLRDVARHRPGFGPAG
jgi:hypothetical protein